MWFCQRTKSQNLERSDSFEVREIAYAINNKKGAYKKYIYNTTKETEQEYNNIRNIAKSAVLHKS